jgi:hypothetical protein
MSPSRWDAIDGDARSAMIIREAKEIARRWVLEEGSRTPGFHGAFFTGSTNWLPDEAALPPSSDVDVTVVRNGADVTSKPGKFSYGGLILEVTHLPAEQVQSAQDVLGHFHLAGNFRTPNVILDPTGELTALQAAVSRDFATRGWVLARTEHARSIVSERLQDVDESQPLRGQALTCLMAAGVSTYVLLVAGLRNPTVRKRYLATRELLAEFGHLDLYPALLEALGCAEMGAERVAHHLGQLARVFDAASEIRDSPFYWASDLSAAARPIIIDGSQEMIDRGDHREALFWMAVTYGKCLMVLDHGGSADALERFEQGNRELLADLGLQSYPDCRRRITEVEGLLPRIQTVAEQIIAVHPEIKD